MSITRITSNRVPHIERTAAGTQITLQPRGIPGPPGPPGGGASELADLSDVDPSGATDGQSLVYDAGLGEWVPGAPVGGEVDYADLPAGTVLSAAAPDGGPFVRPTSRTDLPVMWVGPGAVPTVIPPAVNGGYNGIDLGLSPA